MNDNGLYDYWDDHGVWNDCLDRARHVVKSLDKDKQASTGEGRFVPRPGSSEESNG